MTSFAEKHWVSPHDLSLIHYSFLSSSALLGQYVVSLGSIFCCMEEFTKKKTRRFPCLSATDYPGPRGFLSPRREYQATDKEYFLSLHHFALRLSPFHGSSLRKPLASRVVTDVIIKRICNTKLKGGTHSFILKKLSKLKSNLRAMKMTNIC